MESSIGRGGLGGSLGALRRAVLENERNRVVLDNQRDVGPSIAFPVTDLQVQATFDSARDTCDYLICSKLAYYDEH